MQNEGSINKRLSKLENDERRKFDLEAKRSRFRDEKATITLTVDFAGNWPVEENRQTKSAKFSVGTTFWIRRSNQGTNRTSRFAKGTETNSQNGHYVRSYEKKVE